MKVTFKDATCTPERPQACKGNRGRVFTDGTYVCVCAPIGCGKYQWVSFEKSGGDLCVGHFGSEGNTLNREFYEVTAELVVRRKQ